MLLLPSLLLRFFVLSTIICVNDDSACCNQFYLVGKDVLAKAKTGTGKTVAFLVKHYIFSIREYLKCCMQSHLQMNVYSQVSPVIVGVPSSKMFITSLVTCVITHLYILDFVEQG